MMMTTMMLLLAGCKLSIRKTKEPFHLRFTYKDRSLRAEYDIGATNTHEYRMCFVAPDLDLPTGNYFGLSAQTGGLADNHDVYSFVTKSLGNEPTTRINPKFGELPRAQAIPTIPVETAQPDDQISQMYAEIMKLKKPEVNDDNSQLLNDLTSSLSKIQEYTQSLSVAMNRMSTVLSNLGGSDDKISDLNAKTQYLIQQIKDSRDREERDRERIQREIGAIGQIVSSQSSYMGWGVFITVTIFGGLIGGTVMWIKKNREQRSRKLL